MSLSHCQVADILNKIFSGIDAKAGYIGSDSNPCFMIFTNIDIGMNQPLSLSIPEGDVSALTIVQLIKQIMRMNNTKTVSPAVAQMLNAVRYAS